MTRTERSLSLRALAKDRSEARNGMDSHVPKNGAGAHNWGSFKDDRTAILDDEFEDEPGGKRLLYDVQLNLGLTRWQRGNVPLPSTFFFRAASELQAKKATVIRRTSSVTDEDRENAIKVRKNALKSNGGMFFCGIVPFLFCDDAISRGRPRGHRSLFRRRLWLSPFGICYRIRTLLCAE